MYCFAFANQKGGVGKTTTVVNVGAALAAQGKRVLLVDLDPQGHLTNGLGIRVEPGRPTLVDFVTGVATFADVAVSRGTLTVLPAHLDMIDAEPRLSTMLGREHLLRDALQPVTGFDFCLLDCPPAVGLWTVNALAMANELQVPLQAQFLAIQGMKQLLDVVAMIQKRINPGLRYVGIVPTMFNRNKNLNRQVVDIVRTGFGPSVSQTVIRENVSLAEAPSHGLTIFEYAESSNGAKDYRLLASEILERLTAGGAA